MNPASLMVADSDAALVARLRARHPGAFEELYRLHRDGIWRFLRQLAGDHAQAQDLFQDTWLAAARHAHELRPDTEPRRWLFTIARNKFRNALRLRIHDDHRKSGLSDESPPESPAPDVRAELRERAARVSAAFQSLSDAFREVLLLSAVEGLDAPRVGVILDLSPEAVRKRLSRARAELTRLMQTPAARTLHLVEDPHA